MAYFYRNYRRRWWRPRPYHRRRRRRPFRRYRWRRYRVRNKKLKYLRLKEWQPKVIRKLSVKGMYCLFQCNHRLLNRNYTQYKEDIPPEGIPAGGGYSLNVFTLDSLFTEHEKARNKWSRGNKNLPLIRYTGCEFKIYRPKYTDALVKFQNCYPMKATNLTYTGTQPYIMSMSLGTKRIKRLSDTANKKPYKKFKFKPPEQMTNKWFFSADLAKKGLILVAATAADFNNIYISPYSESDTISFKVLNTKIFQNRHFATLPTSGYHPKDGFWLWASENGSNDPQFKQMIFLGDTTQYKQGHAIHTLEGITDDSTIADAINKLTQTTDNWGNPFAEIYMDKIHRIWRTNNSPTITLSQHKDKKVTENISKLGFTEVQQELYFNVRYNPNRDKGYNTQIYFLTNWQEKTGWDPPTNPNLILTGFPIWLIVWGWTDYHLRLSEITNIDTHYLTVIQSDAIEPQNLHLDAWVILDKTFTHGDSEWHEDHGRTDWDNTHWYPMTHYQMQTLENIAQSGPMTAHLADKKTEELHCEYTFYFKTGGCVPPMDKITNPSNQPIYPIPTNIANANSLQSPTEPIETYLYSFDERRGEITQTAADRISKDYKSAKHLFTDTTTTGTDIEALQTFPKIQDSSEEEETQETPLFQQLIKQRLKQQRIRQRIQQLLIQLQQST
nr:MAG: ORF1 [TTV-like mini virus]